MDNSTSAELANGGGKGAGQVVGFFSKEKLSWDNNNLACIVIFPPWQRKGLGKILMTVSYELSRAEGRMGGPERREFFSWSYPLSFCFVIIIKFTSLYFHLSPLPASLSLCHL